MVVVLVEDDRIIGEGLELGLRQRGFLVYWVQSGKVAVDFFRHETADIMILDLGLPDISGTAVLKKLRQQDLDLPLIVLTARDSVTSKIELLDLGADDYVIKPFSTDELAARIRAVVRRKGGRATEVIRHGGVTVDVSAREVHHNNIAVKLTTREYLVLHTLISYPGRVFSTDYLISLLENDGHDRSSNVIQVHIHGIRKKLGSAHTIIKTVRGVGYMIR